MKSLEDARRLEAVEDQQRGVFSTADLRVLLQDGNKVSFSRRVRRLMDAGVLRRFCRGWYVAEAFDPGTLSQRISPDSYISFANALARDLMIGPSPERQVMAVRPGPAKRHLGAGVEVVQLHISSHLFFGYQAFDGVRYADKEKATLDVLYFHLRGQKYVFDPFSDIDLSRLKRSRLQRYLARYRNPKFVSFAERTLRLT